MFGKECNDRSFAKSLHGAALPTFHVTKYILKHDLQTNNFHNY